MGLGQVPLVHSSHMQERERNREDDRMLIRCGKCKYALESVDGVLHDFTHPTPIPQSNIPQKTTNTIFMRAHYANVSS